jgi:peptide deformylase
VIYPIVKLGAAVLERRAERVASFDAELSRLVEDMFETMYAAHGCGLAAPQVGVSRRVAVIDGSFGENPEAKLVLVNPEIVRANGSQVDEEGCLSIPGFRAPIRRAQTVRIRAQSYSSGEWFEGVGDGLLARAILHECDHLDGRLCTRRVGFLRRLLSWRQIRLAAAMQLALLAGCAPHRPVAAAAPQARRAAPPRPGDIVVLGCTEATRAGDATNCICRRARTHIDTKDPGQTMECRSLARGRP